MRKMWFIVTVDMTRLWLFCFIALCAISMPISALNIEEQRQQYLDARKAFSAGDVKTFNKLVVELKTYPLYPYLRYYYLRQRLHKVDEAEVKEFISTHPDFIFTTTLKSSWLRQLARQKKWQTFLENYTQTDSKRLRCLQLTARIKTDNEVGLLEDTRSIWLIGESLPSACDLAFKRLYASELMTNQLLWQRIKLSMENGKVGLASYLSRSLDKEQRVWGKRWLAMHNNPRTQFKKAKYQDINSARDILLYGIKRLAQVNLNLALKYWQTIQHEYSFTPIEREQIDFLIVVQAIKTKHAKASTLLNNMDAHLYKEELFDWRLRDALKNGDWHKLKQWTNAEPPDQESIKYRWIYWHARALEEIGDIEGSRESYNLIASQRDYYGFLAADRLNAPYHMQFHALPKDSASENRVLQLPGVRRAKELFILYGDNRARREWQHTLQFMDRYEQQIAAAIAYEWGWYDHTILTLAKAKAFDDLNLRFPVFYHSEVKQHAIAKLLEPSWVFAVIRSESAFLEKAKSPAGALGLMQIMPATGRSVAKSLGMKKFRTNNLLVASTNIEIGTAYMQVLQNKFNNNYLLATAAYNAGPNNVIRWLPKKNCQLADLWTELIPFYETRAYVKRVMFYASIYDHQLQKEVRPLKQRMLTVYPLSTTAEDHSILCS